MDARGIVVAYDSDNDDYYDAQGDESAWQLRLESGQTRPHVHEGGYPDRLFLQPVDENFKCSICIGVAREPTLCNNDHLFCAGCIDMWLKQNSTCPFDRAALTRGLILLKLLCSSQILIKSSSLLTV